MRQRGLALGAPPADDAYVFADPEGRPWRPDVCTNRFGRLRDRLGYDRVRLHDLRHFVATVLGNSGTHGHAVRMPIPSATNGCSQHGRTSGSARSVGSPRRETSTTDPPESTTTRASLTGTPNPLSPASGVLGRVFEDILLGWLDRVPSTGA